MMKVLTLIVSSFILIPKSDVSARMPPMCGCKPDIIDICASNGKTYSSVCEMNCDFNYVGLEVVNLGPCDNYGPIPSPANKYPPIKPDKIYIPPPPSPRVIVLPPPSNVPPRPIGLPRPLIGSAGPHG